MLKRMPGAKSLPSGSAEAAGTGAAVDLGPLEDMLGYVLRRAQLAVFKSFRAIYRGAGVTPAQLSVLLVIERNPGLRQTQVSDALGIKRANFVAVIDALQRRGLAERTPAADRRSNALRLTPRGKRFIKSLHVLAQEHEARIAAALTPGQRGELLRALEAVTASLRDVPDVGPSVDDDE